jgi:MFS family permease
MTQMNPTMEAETAFRSFRLSDAMPARWIVVFAGTIAVAAAYGEVGTIGVLLAPFQAEFAQSKASVSLAFTLLSIGAAIGGLLAGRLADRLPARWIIMVGAFAMGLGSLAIGFQVDFMAMQVLYLMTGFFGFACLYSPVLTVVSLWFRQGAGLALGIVTAGAALGQAIVPTLFQGLVVDYGWRNACMILGCVYIVALMPLMALLEKPQASSGAAAATSLPARWPIRPAISLSLVGAAALFCCVLMGVPSVHLISFARESGLSMTTGASLLTAVMVAGCVGRVLTGLLVDRVGSLRSYAIVSAIQTVGVFGFPQVHALWALYVVAIVYGFGFGGALTGMVCCVRDALPSKQIGSGMALVAMFAWLGMGLGGYQGGLCFDLTGNYALSFTSAAIAGVANLASLGLLGLLIVKARARRPYGGIGDHR